jgi:hypothetical protein
LLKLDAAGADKLAEPAPGGLAFLAFSFTPRPIACLRCVEADKPDVSPAIV